MTSMSPAILLCLALSLTVSCRNKNKNSNTPDSGPGPRVVAPVGTNNPDPTRTPSQGPGDGSPSPVVPGDSSGQAALLQGASIVHIASGDVTGDGREDLVYFTDKGVAVAVSSGAGFASPTLWTIEFVWGDFDASPRLVGDINGDGKADIVGFRGTGSFAALSTGRRFDGLRKVTDDFAPNGSSDWSSQNTHPRFLADVNGDGRSDIVGCKDLGCYVALANESDSFGETKRQAWIKDFATQVDGTTSSEGWVSMDQYPRALADVDGDGRADILGFGERGVWLSYSLGNSFQAKEEDGLILAAFGERSETWSRQSQAPRLVGDIDGDGRADIVGFAKDGQVYAAFGADGLASVRRLQSSSLLSAIDELAIAGRSLQERPRLLMDIDADGADELVMISSADNFGALRTIVIKLD